MRADIRPCWVAGRDKRPAVSFVAQQRALAGKSMEELQAMKRAVEADPGNHNPPGSFWIYTKAAQGRLAAITWAIVYKLDKVAVGGSR